MDNGTPGVEPDVPGRLREKQSELLTGLSRLGVNYYTRREALEESRGDPPDVYEVSPVEEQGRRYGLLGLDFGDVAHYCRGDENRVEVKRFDYTLVAWMLIRRNRRCSGFARCEAAAVC